MDADYRTVGARVEIYERFYKLGEIKYYTVPGEPVLAVQIRASPLVGSELPESRQLLYPEVGVSQ